MFRLSGVGAGWSGLSTLELGRTGLSIHDLPPSLRAAALEGEVEAAGQVSGSRPWALAFKLARDLGTAWVATDHRRFRLRLGRSRSSFLVSLPNTLSLALAEDASPLFGVDSSTQPPSLPRERSLMTWEGTLEARPSRLARPG